MNTNELLKGITKNYVKDFRLACEISRDARMKELRPGERIPEGGIIYGDDARRQFELRAEGYRAKANYIIDVAMEKANEQLMEAPSEEAVRSIQLFAMRDKATTEDLVSLMNAYGDNVQCYDTIRDVALQKGLPVNVMYDEHPIRGRMKNIETVRSEINSSLNLFKSEKGYISDGFMSLVDADIDRAFDPEERE